MDRLSDLLLTDLRYLIRELGQGGGQMSPSVYDTAQVVRLVPPEEGAQPALEWLLGEQQADGGWGNPFVPISRDAPTLAALLALAAHDPGPRAREAMAAGLAFLRGQTEHWRGQLPDDLPVGVELLIPCLLDESEAMGLAVPRRQYAELLALGERRRRMIARIPLRAGTTLAHSFEALGRGPDRELQDSTGGIGHSPAATAAWLRAAGGRSELTEACLQARQYLVRAAAATGTGIPGVVPTAWPITRFEQAFALYALLISGLFHHPRLADVLNDQLAMLKAAIRTTGLGFSDEFEPDGDDTVSALAVLKAAGYEIELATLRGFAVGDHFCAYQGELQAALSVTAHATHVLALCGQDSSRQQAYLEMNQQADGRWLGDKWNGSWLYPTCRAMIVLKEAGQSAALKRAVDVVVAEQHADGGWGTHGSSPEETAYGVLALRPLVREGLVNGVVKQAVERGEQWMRQDYRPFNPSPLRCWLAKETYRPRRIARMIELAATMPLCSANWT